MNNSRHFNYNSIRCRKISRCILNWMVRGLPQAMIIAQPTHQLASAIYAASDFLCVRQIEKLISNEWIRVEYCPENSTAGRNGKEANCTRASAPPLPTTKTHGFPLLSSNSVRFFFLAERNEQTPKAKLKNGENSSFCNPSGNFFCISFFLRFRWFFCAFFSRSSFANTIQLFVGSSK